ncbi:filamentous phage phiLf adsorption protein III [Xanthomonas axonopodis pv. vasculorum]|uniref:Filamentous phage phiLf adsorption protein III n=1 Tax=Xanthomonas axonopodis pv. vasculorum TaxID=325777 RepID=A0A098PY75_9XANT|nr:filamentous phage phiLf adsorption protein III [Xanthomonas axonopodis pv. vasculorum]
MESVVSKFATQVRGTPLVGGIGSFMTVPSGGSCPVFSLGASKWWNAMTIDFHCSGTFLAFLRACGWVIFAIAAYAAIRIALT